MGWKEIDDKLKKKRDSNFVACSEEWELETIKETVLEEFPWLGEQKVMEVVRYCCKEVKPPRSREEFLECLKEKLGV